MTPSWRWRRLRWNVWVTRKALAARRVAPAWPPLLCSVMWQGSLHPWSEAWPIRSAALHVLGAGPCSRTCGSGCRIALRALHFMILRCSMRASASGKRAMSRRPSPYLSAPQPTCDREASVEALSPDGRAWCACIHHDANCVVWQVRPPWCSSMQARRAPGASERILGSIDEAVQPEHIADQPQVSGFAAAHFVERARLRVHVGEAGVAALETGDFPPRAITGTTRTCPPFVRSLWQTWKDCPWRRWRAGHCPARACARGTRPGRGPLDGGCRSRATG